MYIGWPVLIAGVFRRLLKSPKIHLSCGYVNCFSIYSFGLVPLRLRDFANNPQ